jgi:hypothetical protein
MKKYHLALLFMVFLFIGCSKSHKKNDLQKYNLSGKVKEIIGKEIEPMTFTGDRVIIRFNEKGYITEKEFPDKRNSSEDEYFDWKQVFQYDENWNLKFIEHLDTNGKIIAKEVFKFDGKANMIEKARVGKNRGEFNKQTYKYDDKGNVVEEINYIDDNPAVRYSNKYDNNGKVIENDIFQFVVVDMPYKQVKVSIIYDGKGNITETSTLIPNSSLVKTSYKYDFDDHGNWTKVSLYIIDKLQVTNNREISYY